MRAVALGLRFFLELACLAVLGVAGWQAVDAPVAQVVLAVALPLAGAAWWGAFAAPRARYRLADPGRFVAEVAFFVVAGLALARVAGPAAGVALVALCVADAAVLRRYPEPDPAGDRPTA